jgi:hypothetical protein
MKIIRGCVVAGALVALGLMGCKAEAPTPTPGTLTVSLSSPNADDGAVLFMLTGPGIQTAQAANSAYKSYWRLVSATELRFMVVGNLTNGTVATITVDDTHKVDQYKGTLLDAASRTDAARSSLASYKITVSR